MQKLSETTENPQDAKNIISDSDKADDQKSSSDR